MNPIGAIVESVTKNLGLLNAKIDIPPDYAATLRDKGCGALADWVCNASSSIYSLSIKTPAVRRLTCYIALQ